MEVKQSEVRRNWWSHKILYQNSQIVFVFLIALKVFGYLASILYAFKAVSIYKFINNPCVEGISKSGIVFRHISCLYLYSAE